MSNMWVVGFGAGAGFGAGDTIAVTAGISLTKEDKIGPLVAKGGWPPVLG